MGGIKLHALLLLAVLLSGLAALLPLAWSGAEGLSASYRENAAREVEASARLFSLAVPPGADTATPARLRELAAAARRAGGFRYTLIAPDGTVLADSDEDAERMENHLHRPEVQAALAGGTGIEIRPSPTLGTDWIYAATRLDDGRVIRAAASMQQLDERLARWWTRSLVAFAVSLAILVVLAFLIAHRLAKPLEEAAAGAERYAAGDFSYRLPASGGFHETRKLSAAMGVMAGELSSRFTLITRQREEMRAVFDNMSDGVLAVDAGGRIMLMNGMAESLLGIDRSSTGASLVTRVRNADLLAIIREANESEEPREREIRVPGAGNGESLVQVHAARLHESGGDRGVLVVLRDVTRLRQLEIMRRDFVANVSHELRTPITAIQSCLETALDDAADAGGDAPFLEMALRNTRRMGSIIDNLLFLAGMEVGAARDTGRIAVSPVAPVIDEAVAQCRAEASVRKVGISVDCGDGLTALMNSKLIVHALVNLMDNAIKYGPEGDTIAVTARAEGETVRISVSDHGPGIAPRHRSRIFERFYRVDGRARVKQGSGLGLSIVKHIAQSQGGGIQLESEIGAGSTFTLIIPGGGNREPLNQ